MTRLLIAAAAATVGLMLSTGAGAGHVHGRAPCPGHDVVSTGWHPGWTGSWGRWADGAPAFISPGYYTPCGPGWGPCYVSTW